MRTTTSPPNYILKKLRLSDHQLMIEKGRISKLKLPHAERIWPICSSAVEDETHFLLECMHVNYIKYSRTFLDLLLSKYPYLSNLERESQFISIISYKDPTSCRALAKYIFRHKKERKYILSQST